MHKVLRDIISKQRIIVIGGGTGGHIQPILNLLEHRESLEGVTWIGGKNSEEERSAIQKNIPFLSIPTLKLPSTRSWKIILSPFVLIIGIIRSCFLLKRIHPEVVFSKGWPGSVAVGIAAWLLRVPLWIHESDTIPGRSNTLLSYFATGIFLGFEQTKKYFEKANHIMTWQILSRVYEDGYVVKKRSETILWKYEKLPHVLIICGSQWSRVIYEEVLAHLEELLVHMEIVIILGKLNTHLRVSFEERSRSLRSRITLLDWVEQEDLRNLIEDTDIAVTRGSATTLAELTSLTPDPHLIIIPLPTAAKNHQHENALVYQDMGHTLFPQSELPQLTSLLISHANIITERTKMTQSRDSSRDDQSSQGTQKA